MEIDDEQQSQRRQLWDRLVESDTQCATIRLPPEYREKQWNPIRTLGEGAFGEVRLLADSANLENMVAAKCLTVDVSGRVEEMFKKIRLEALVMRAVHRSEHVINYIGMRYYAGEIQMFLEYADGGELFEVIEPDRGIPMWKAKLFFRQIIAGLKFIHSYGIAHRDIKPENLLLTKNDQLKICDFGLATMFRHRGVERILKTKCGTLQYIAPQVVEGNYKGEAADIWSTGVVLVAMLSGALPFAEPTTDCPAYRRWISGLEWRYAPPWENFDGPTLNLLRKMLDQEENKRITIPGIEDHEFYLRDDPDAPGRRKVAKQPQRAVKETEPKPMDVDNVPQLKSITNLRGGIKIYKPSKKTASEDVIMKSESVRFTAVQSLSESPQRKKRRLSAVSDSTIPFNPTVSVSPVSQPNPSHGISQAIRESRLDALTGNFFSQPVGVELLTQIDYSSNQHPLTMLARRMTRFCVTKGTNETMALIKARLDIKFTCVQRAPNILAVSGPRNRMAYVITVYEMLGSEGRMVMVDFRRSCGDGIEFKRAFLDLKQKLADILSEPGNTWMERRGLLSVP